MTLPHARRWLARLLSLAVAVVTLAVARLNALLPSWVGTHLVNALITAAEALGCSTPRILFTEIAPNVMNHLIVIATLEMAHAILLEAALSFLGLGVQPPTPSWGLMVSEAKALMYFDPWLITIPGVALFLLVLSINLVGDGLRDVTAPENRN